MRALVVVAGLASAVVYGPGTVASPLPAASVPDFRNVETATRTAGDDAYEVLGRWSDNEDARRPMVGAGVSTATEWESRFYGYCMDENSEKYTGPCDIRLGLGVLVCSEGETPRQSRWTRFRVPPATEWSDWELQDYGSCVGPGGAVAVLTAEEFRRLPLPAPVLHLQRTQDWVLVNIETIVYTDPTPVTLTTDVLGVPVTVQATPSRFTYDWGDGHSTTTRDPGRPYPALDVFHEYEQPGTVEITLTTEWTGRYQVTGDPQWRDVAGTATTSTTSRQLDVQERTARLVTGTCFDEPDAPGCEGWTPAEARR